MRSSLWKVVRSRIGQSGSLYSVCAWCRRVYTPDIIMTDPLDDKQYAEIQSHGICKECKKSQLKDARRNPGKAFRCGSQE